MCQCRSGKLSWTYVLLVLVVIPGFSFGGIFSEFWGGTEILIFFSCANGHLCLYLWWLHFLDQFFAESKDWAESLIWTLIFGLSPKPD